MLADTLCVHVCLCVCVCYVGGFYMCIVCDEMESKDLSNYLNSVIMCSREFPTLVNALLGGGVRVRVGIREQERSKEDQRYY